MKSVHKKNRQELFTKRAARAARGKEETYTPPALAALFVKF
jgi:hypothetical protein